MTERDDAIDFINQMPKVETHVHLDGSLTLSTIRALIKQQQYIPLMGLTEEELYNIVVCKGSKPLGDVLKHFSSYIPYSKPQRQWNMLHTS